MKNLIGIPTVYGTLGTSSAIFSLQLYSVIRCAPLCLRHSSWGLGSYTVRSDQYICHIIPVSQCGPGLESRVWSTCGLAPSALAPRPRSPYFAEHIACTTHEASHDLPWACVLHQSTALQSKPSNGPTPTCPSSTPSCGRFQARRHPQSSVQLPRRTIAPTPAPTPHLDGAVAKRTNRTSTSQGQLLTTLRAAPRVALLMTAAPMTAAPMTVAGIRAAAA